ncbi:MAG TPA: hypothetical protein VEH06_15640, partial [Candidatus Bathyarchaeia archaeon]|nr:hypothetical protein [Candidatus Bathyarchaeia archaeon]
IVTHTTIIRDIADKIKGTKHGRWGWHPAFGYGYYQPITANVTDSSSIAVVKNKIIFVYCEKLKFPSLPGALSGKINYD